MKKSKKSSAAIAMRIDVRLEYHVVWGDYGAEWHELKAHVSCRHSSDEAIVSAMNSVLAEWKDFLDYHASEQARIHWGYAHWKSADEKEYHTENLRLLNQPGIGEPINNSKRNCLWQIKQ